jgi:integrase
MSSPDSTSSDRPDQQPDAPTGKPAKPSKDFPLFPHATRRWAKKINGRLHYFGSWSDGPDAALARYLAEKDRLHGAGTPPVATDVRVKDVANAYLNHKKHLFDAGEIATRTWEDDRFTCDLLVSRLGKTKPVAGLTAADFASLRAFMAGRWGPKRLAVMVQRIRSIFKFAADADLIDRPVKFGPGFKGPTQKTLRIHRAARGKKLFPAEEIRRMLDAAGVPLKAMILLGINAGFGNADCGRLPKSAVDLDGGVVDYPRPKTGVDRRCPLWPETVQALREAIADRPDPKDARDDKLVFLTQTGRPWSKEVRDSPLTCVMGKLLKRLGLNGRSGLNFYTLRHTHRTVADEARDQPAADLIMGHLSRGMSSVYREHISDTRLRAVVDHVRSWLFPETKTPTE